MLQTIKTHYQSLYQHYISFPLCPSGAVNDKDMLG